MVIWYTSPPDCPTVRWWSLAVNINLVRKLGAAASLGRRTEPVDETKRVDDETTTTTTRWPGHLQPSFSSHSPVSCSARPSPTPRPACWDTPRSIWSSTATSVRPRGTWRRPSGDHFNTSTCHQSSNTPQFRPEWPCETFLYFLTLQRFTEQIINTRDPEKDVNFNGLSIKNSLKLLNWFVIWLQPSQLQRVTAVRGSQPDRGVGPWHRWGGEGRAARHTDHCRERHEDPQVWRRWQGDGNRERVDWCGAEGGGGVAEETQEVRPARQQVEDQDSHLQGLQVVQICSQNRT